jgi:hypothetical protein
MTELLITGLHHDLGLDVPFKCAPDDLPDEARKALKALSEELASATVATPP